jgi:hypothetical protein
LKKWVLNLVVSLEIIQWSISLLKIMAFLDVMLYILVPN